MAVALTSSEVMALGGYCEGARAYYSSCGVYVFMQGNGLRFLHTVWLTQVAHFNCH
jgi:hypothetical protein